MRQCAVRVIQLIGILEHPASRWLKHRTPLLWWTTVVGTYQHGHLDEKKAVIGYLHIDPYGMETASLLHRLAHSMGLYIYSCARLFLKSIGTCQGSLFV